MANTLPDQPRVALVFDFDGTLARDSTTQFLRHHGVDTDRFWTEVEPRVLQGWDPVPAYLYQIWRLSQQTREWGGITQEAFRAFGAGMEFFPGVDSLFQRLREQVAAAHPGTRIEYYMISSGIGEILRASAIAGEFVRIWASDFQYDEQGALEFPRNIVSFTDKTRYLFELSKGLAYGDGPNEPFAVNRRIPRNQLRIPLRQVVFVGDGYTDVPCFKIVRTNGGVAIGVYEEGRREDRRELGLLEDDRVSDLVPADYRSGSRLSRLLDEALDTVAASAGRPDEA
jgi:phosphoglycolate phosphatase-like HAD superfamily hydrolase